jgi:DNA-binding GntR family transcriptional regulator
VAIEFAVTGAMRVSGLVTQGAQLDSALDDRHADHARIRRALRAGDQDAARAEMEKHIVGTVDVIRA